MRSKLQGFYIKLKLFRIPLSLAVSVSCLSGYFIAGGDEVGIMILLLLTSMTHAMGCSAINQSIEFGIDMRMERCKDRPIPMGVISKGKGFVFGVIFVITSLIIGYLISPVIPLLLIINLLIYNVLYTYLKFKTSFALLIGGISGIMPPLIGWISYKSIIDVGLGFINFLIIIYFWQVVHFMFILDLYKQDYIKVKHAMSRLLSRHFGKISFVWILCYYLLFIFWLVFFTPFNNLVLVSLGLLFISFIVLVFVRRVAFRYLIINLTLPILFVNSLKF